MGRGIGYVGSLAMDGPKEKTLGANLHVCASLLNTGVFRIYAD